MSKKKRNGTCLSLKNSKMNGVVGMKRKASENSNKKTDKKAEKNNEKECIH